MDKKATKKIVILYDGGCSDGFSGAWVARKKFGNRADYIGVKHSEPLPAGLKNKEIYLIDFTYPVEIIKKLLKENKRVTAIDHHATVEQATKLTRDYLYAVDHSGAVLAWQYFYPNRPIPLLLKYVEDTDLYRLKLPKTREAFAYLNIFNLDFKIWDKLIKEFQNPISRKQAFEKGALILRYQTRLEDKLVLENAELVEFSGHKTLAVNSANWPSDIGNKLVVKLPPIGIIWYRKSDKIVVSLRSSGAVDVGKLAERFGGGGHKKSSGFVIPLNKKLPWRPIKF